MLAGTWAHPMRCLPPWERSGTVKLSDEAVAIGEPAGRRARAPAERIVDRAFPRAGPGILADQERRHHRVRVRAVQEGGHGASYLSGQDIAARVNKVRVADVPGPLGAINFLSRQQGRELRPVTEAVAIIVTDWHAVLRTYSPQAVCPARIRTPQGVDRRRDMVGIEPVILVQKADDIVVHQQRHRA